MRSNIQKALKNNIDLDYKVGATNFFKEEFHLEGVRTPIVRKIGNCFYKDVKNLPLKDFFIICGELLSQKEYEYFVIGSQWLFKRKEEYRQEHFKLFEKWLQYITNWARCDDYCTHLIGYMIMKFDLDNYISWTRSKNRWMRRASAVSLIYPIKKEGYLKEAFNIADILLEDEDDLVRKGYGWMLKEASNFNEDKVFDYVMKNKDRMPRVSLRYAIEKMTKDHKKMAMLR